MIMKTAHLDKDELMRHAANRMDTELAGHSRSLRETVALTCNILFRHGHDSGLAGQITALLPDGSGHYLTQRLGLGFDEIDVANLLVVDRDLNVIEGQGMPNPANRFHSWIYDRRPDVRCIVHTHPLHTSALSMLGEPLAIAHMDSCMLYGEVAWLPEWPGVPVGNDEGKIISEVLGGRKAALLAHHGLVVAGSSVEEACVIAVQFERAARLHLLARAAGEIKKIPDALAKEAHDWILTDRRSKALFDYYARGLIRYG
ncbi:aldolase [Paraburkholderia edwinii]|uniref:Aldolase n=1 Tax=Paraburkholderia edwinii TaxID=2861782 RepID=A0ABX8V2Z8_9BURK|nr:aldolase [Paraburkholderia edwinii]